MIYIGLAILFGLFCFLSLRIVMLQDEIDELRERVDSIVILTGYDGDDDPPGGVIPFTREAA